MRRSGVLLSPLAQFPHVICFALLSSSVPKHIGRQTVSRITVKPRQHPLPRRVSRFLCGSFLDLPHFPELDGSPNSRQSIALSLSTDSTVVEHSVYDGSEMRKVIICVPKLGDPRGIVALFDE